MNLRYRCFLSPNDVTTEIIHYNTLLSGIHTMCSTTTTTTTINLFQVDKSKICMYIKKR